MSKRNVSIATINIGIMPKTSSFHMTVFSLPVRPTVMQPTMALAGMMILPKDAPAVCAARIKGTLRFNNCAVCICSKLNNTLELLLLPVMNEPNS